MKADSRSVLIFLIIVKNLVDEKLCNSVSSPSHADCDEFDDLRQLSVRRNGRRVRNNGGTIQFLQTGKSG